MNIRQSFVILAFCAIVPAFASNFSDDDFPFQHECCPSSAESDDEKPVFFGSGDENYDEIMEGLLQHERKAFLAECDGIKMPKGVHPVEVTRSVALRVSSFYRAKLRWIARRIGSDKMLTAFFEYYHPGKLNETEQKRFENYMTSAEFTIANLACKTTDAYLAKHLCGESYSNLTLLGLLADGNNSLLHHRNLPIDFDAKKMMAFVTQIFPGLKGIDSPLGLQKDTAHKMMILAYEKACIIFMKDFVEALRTPEKTFREPFNEQPVKTCAQLYMEVKPAFKKGYKPKTDRISGFRGREFTRFELREGKHLLPQMNELFRTEGFRGIYLVPADDTSGSEEEPE